MAWRAAPEFQRGSLAAIVGISPVIIHYSFMALVSVTVVGAFESVGSILVVALFVAPPAAALLLTDRLGPLLGLSVLAGALSALGGYRVAQGLDVSIAGSMASMSGLLFFLTYLLAPDRGVVAQWRRRRDQRLQARLRMLAGGSLTSYESLVDRARREAVLRMKDQARRAGADSVFDVRLETASISKGEREAVGSVEVLAYGTALRRR